MDNRLLLLLLTMCATMWHATGDTACNKMLRELADAQSHFIYCSTSHAVPVPPKDERLCVGCKLLNDAMSEKYGELMKNCSKEYNDADRMNIVLTTQNMLKELWNKAYCESECDFLTFPKLSHLITTNLPPPPLSLFRLLYQQRGDAAEFYATCHSIQ